MADADIKSGQLGSSYTVRCALCHKEITITEGVVIDGRRRLYRGTIELELRIRHLWSKYRGKWYCPDCQEEIIH